MSYHQGERIREMYDLLFSKTMRKENLMKWSREKREGERERERRSFNGQGKVAP